MCVSVGLEEQLKSASEQEGLQPWYRDLVRPLLKQPRDQWPECCGGNCEPCARTLIAVAERILDGEPER